MFHGIAQPNPMSLYLALPCFYLACTDDLQTPIKTNKTTRGRRTRLTTAEETDIDSTEDGGKENMANNVKRQTRTRAGGSKKRFYHK